MARLTERQLALLLAKVRQELPDEAHQLERHFEASDANDDFMALFERIITAANESSTVGRDVIERLNINTQTVGQLERLIERWVESNEERNKIDRERLAIEAEARDHEQKLESARLEHERHLQEQRQLHGQEMDTLGRKQLYKLAGAVTTGLIGGGGLAQLVGAVTGAG